MWTTADEHERWGCVSPIWRQPIPERDLGRVDEGEEARSWGGRMLIRLRGVTNCPPIEWFRPAAPFPWPVALASSRCGRYPAQSIWATFSQWQLDPPACGVSCQVCGGLAGLRCPHSDPTRPVPEWWQGLRGGTGAGSAVGGLGLAAVR